MENGSAFGINEVTFTKSGIVHRRLLLFVSSKGESETHEATSTFQPMAVAVEVAAPRGQVSGWPNSPKVQMNSPEFSTVLAYAAQWHSLDF
jgi:hypothetical protein